MTYTEEAKQALSRKVAEKLELTNWYGGYYHDGTWLHDDWHTIMELCVKHGVNVFHASSNFGGKNDLVDIMNSRLDPFYYTDCASPSEAERIARLLALGELCGS